MRPEQHVAQPNIWQNELLVVQRGDIWQLGRHRLSCGDSTCAEDVQRLMQGETAQAVITDPPYGMLETGWDNVTHGFIAPMTALLHEKATVVAFCSLPYGFDLHATMLQSGYQWRWDALWIKGNGGNGVSKRRPIPCHEHLFAYARKGIAAADLLFNGYDAGEPGEPWRRTNASQSSRNQIQIRLRDRAMSAGREDGRRWIRTDLYGRSKNNLPERERTPHPTQKPLEIVEKLALLLTHEGQLIYDPFLGSGTTLLAAHETGRICYGVELSPEYCVLTIQRWQERTGQKAVRS